MKEVIARYTRKDFRVDTFRAGGKGGQHQNKTNSGVRITHLPSGLSSECREYKEQPKNKKEAFRKLSEKILKWHEDLETKEKLKNESTIRTYHAVENRVLDHDSRFKQSYEEVVSDIGPMIEARREFKRSELLKENDV